MAAYYLTITVRDGAVQFALEDSAGQPLGLTELEGRTFQAHRRDLHVLALYPVTLAPAEPGRCPAVLAGEPCGRPAGHGGKHMWGSGD